MHFWFLWLILLRVSVRAEHGVITDVSDETFEFLISGGFKATGNRWSRHVVSIRTVSYLRSPGDNHFCAGILISSRAVLTAAHCLTDRYKATLKPRSIQVVFGHLNRLDNYVEADSRTADRLMVHPDYERYKKNDLAVIRLDRRLPRYNPSAQPILLRRVVNVTEDNTTCVTMGWGQLYLHGPYSDEILYMNVKISPPSDCINKVKGYIQGDICVHPDTKGKLCAGDMGGPLVCHGALVGVIVGTLGCAEGKPIKFVSFMDNKEWIEKTVFDFRNVGVTLTMDILLFWLGPVGWALKSICSFCIKVKKRERVQWTL